MGKVARKKYFFLDSLFLLWGNDEDKRMRQICSNCGWEDNYLKKDWRGREDTLCKKCGHTLSICLLFGVKNERNN